MFFSPRVKRTKSETMNAHTVMYILSALLLVAFAFVLTIRWIVMKKPSPKSTEKYMAVTGPGQQPFLVTVKNIASNALVAFQVVLAETATGNRINVYPIIAHGQKTEPISLTPDQCLQITGSAGLNNMCSGGKAGVYTAYQITFQDIFGTNPTTGSTEIDVNAAYCWNHGCNFIYFSSGVQPGAPGTRQTCK
jgi:hypothetical protein